MPESQGYMHVMCSVPVWEAESEGYRRAAVLNGVEAAIKAAQAAGVTPTRWQATIIAEPVGRSIEVEGDAVDVPPNMGLLVEGIVDPEPENSVEIEGERWVLDENGGATLVTPAPDPATIATVALAQWRLARMDGSVETPIRFGHFGRAMDRVGKPEVAFPDMPTAAQMAARRRILDFLDYMEGFARSDVIHSGGDSFPLLLSDLRTALGRRS